LFQCWTLFYFFWFFYLKKIQKYVVLGLLAEKKSTCNQTGGLKKPPVHRFFRFWAVPTGLTAWSVQHSNQTGHPFGSRFDRSNRPVRFLKHCLLPSKFTQNERPSLITQTNHPNPKTRIQIPNPYKPHQNFNFPLQPFIQISNSKNNR
jgi:hypothetical protein